MAVEQFWDRAAETMPRDELERLQMARVRACVARLKASGTEFYRRRLADVGDVVQLVGRLKDDAARTDPAGCAALESLERAFFDDQELFVLMLMRRMRRFPRIEGGDVDLQLVERRRRRAHDLPNGAPVVRLAISVRPAEDRRFLHRLLGDERAE